MYIWIIASSHPTKAYPLNGIFEYDQAKALANAGNKVIMVCPDIRSIRRKRKLGWEHLTENGVEIYVYSIPIGAVPYPIAQFFSRYAFRKLAKRIIHDHGKSDIAHAHFGVIAACSGRICNEHEIPFVVTEHSSTLAEPLWTEKLRQQSRKAYQYSQALITVGHAVGDRIEQEIGFPYICIPNIVDTTSFSYTRHKEHSRFRFVAVGKLIQRKGFDVLLPAFAAIQKEYKEACLEIVGGGAYQSYLENERKQLMIEDSVTFHGQCTREQINKIFDRCDCFVLASRAETFGVVYIEAMACGLPVIATRCGGPEDFVTEKDGIMVPVDDVEALSTAMKYMIAHHDEYDRTDISNRAKERFSPSVIADRLIGVYEDVRNQVAH